MCWLGFVHKSLMFSVESFKVGQKSLHNYGKLWQIWSHWTDTLAKYQTYREARNFATFQALSQVCQNLSKV